MMALLNVVLPVGMVVGFGYLAARWRMVDQSTIEGLNYYARVFAIPTLLFLAMSRVDFNAGGLGALTFSYYFGTLLSFFLGYWGAIYLFKRSKVDAVSIGFCCYFSNTILLGVPVTERAYGAGALAGNWAIIAFHVPLLYGFGVTMMEVMRSDWTAWIAAVRRVISELAKNSFVIGIVLGLAVNFTGLPLPGPLLEAAEFLMVSALPVALFGLGGTLALYKSEGSFWTIVMVCSIALIFQPLIVILLGTTLELNQAALRSAVLTAGMAPGINAYIFATMYGAAPRVVASSVMFATIASVLTASVWIYILG